MKVLLSTILVASWLLQSCVSDQPDLAGSSGDGCTAAAAKAGEAPRAVRIGVTGALAESAEYLADAEGYFVREGLKVQLINFTSPSRMMPALASGQLDVASGSVGPGLFNATENSLCVKAVGSLARQEPNANGVFLFVRRDLIDSRKVQDYGDLRGLHVALPGRDNTSEYVLAKQLAAGGLTMKDIRVVEMSFPSMLVSLANKSIDAAVLPESLASAAADKNLGLKWKPVADVAPGTESSVLLFSPRLAADHDAAVHWMAAYLEGARDYDAAFFRDQHRSEVVAQLIKASPIKDPHLYSEMGYPRIDPNGAINLASIDDQMNWFIKTGELHDPVNVSQVVDQSFAREAVARLGAY